MVGISKSGPYVGVFDPDGHERVVMHTNSEGSSVVLADEKHRPRILTEIGKKGPQIMILDEASTKYVWRAPQ
jgi:hypothetical protein